MNMIEKIAVLREILYRSNLSWQSKKEFNLDSDFSLEEIVNRIILRQYDKAINKLGEIKASLKIGMKFDGLINEIVLELKGKPEIYFCEICHKEIESDEIWLCEQCSEESDEALRDWN